MNNSRQRIHDCAEIMEWMSASPHHSVCQYLRNRGFSAEEIKQAARYFVMEKK